MKFDFLNDINIRAKCDKQPENQVINIIEKCERQKIKILQKDFSLTVTAVALILISGYTLPTFSPFIINQQILPALS